jgi:hypothetical protein
MAATWGRGLANAAAVAFAVLALCGEGRAQGGVSLTSGGFPSGSGVSVGTPPSSQSPAGTTILATLSFGDLGPRAYSGKVRIVLPVRVSATVPYRVTVQRADAGTGGLKASDIGFGVVNFRTQQSSGARLSPDAIGGIIPAANFGGDPSNARVVNGRPRFNATLE